MSLQFTACDQESNLTTDGKVNTFERGAASDVQHKPGDLPSIQSTASKTQSSKKDHVDFIEITWDDLIPESYRPEMLLAKYRKQLDELPYGDPRAMKIYEQLQAEMDDAPINQEMKGKPVKISGFIAPLEHTDDKVTEFLLVPIFGACIHVPPPPVNQTVLITTDNSSAIHADDIDDPVWVTGVIKAEGESTDIGIAGYRIENARVEIYEE